MSAVLSWAGDDDGLPTQALVHPSRSRARRSQPGELPPEIEQAIWRGCDLGAQAGEVVSSGFAALDAELPGGGWPCQSIAEVLSPQPSVLEWRVIGPALRAIVAAGRNVVVVGPPKTPHLPGLRHSGIDEKHLVWVRADTPAERLWCTEQLVKSGACGALVAWLPQARPEQIRRLQVCAQACEGPVFLFRPAAAQHEASAASLRVMATFALDWEIQVHVLKRRGPTHEGVVKDNDLILIKTCVFHYEFEFIHPFIDGNGRTARLIINLLLMRAGYPPAIIARVNRQQYYRVLAQADRGKTEPLVNFVGRAVERSLTLFLEASTPQTTPPPAEDEWIPLRDAAERVPYSQGYLRLLARTGKLEAMKYGRIWHTTPRALEAYQQSVASE